MNVAVIAPASVLGVLFSFLLLKRAARWNSGTADKIRRVKAILSPVFFGGLLYLTYSSTMPWQFRIFMVASALLTILLVRKWIAGEDMWGYRARETAGVFIVITAILHGFAIVGITSVMMSTDMDAETAALVSTLGSKDVAARTKAVQALGQVHSDGCTWALVASLGDKDDLVRSGAASALSEIGDNRVIGALVAADKKHHSAENCPFCDALHRLGAR